MKSAAHAGDEGGALNRTTPTEKRKTRPASTSPRRWLLEDRPWIGVAVSPPPSTR